MSTLSKFLRSIRQRFGRRSYGLDGLDLKLAAYLDCQRGVFVEAGANDGVTQSNTRYFEEYQGWRGLLVEPVPELAAACRRNRPACAVENVALVPFDYPETTIEMQYCNLMSCVRGAMKSVEEEAEHLRQGTACQNLSVYPLRVPAKTLTAVLDQHGFTHIDLLSLDVEGFELQVLRGLDFERHRPRFMLIEARYREDIEAFLGSRYRPLGVLSCHDVLYQRSDDLFHGD